MSDDPTPDDDTDREGALGEIIGKRIKGVEYNGDYHTPFTLVLDDGTQVYAGGVRERSEDTEADQKGGGQ